METITSAPGHERVARYRDFEHPPCRAVPRQDLSFAHCSFVHLLHPHPLPLLPICGTIPPNESVIRNSPFVNQ